jgi:arylsulfatase A-like enzyme
MITISSKYYFFIILTLFYCFIPSVNASEKLPNIIIIYADDMGYGDLNCQNTDSKIPTPNLDNLATEGMRFTDAHSSSGICSPSRYALLTGTYHWRRQHGIVTSFGKPFFNESDITLPQILKNNGYHTACIGKWHLGWDWEFINKPSVNIKFGNKTRPTYQCKDIDWHKPIKGGPVDRGFDYYFGDGTINFPPYTWFENDRVVEIPTNEMRSDNIGFEVKEGDWEFRPGPKVKDWNPYDVLPALANKTIEWIKKQGNEQPFFLYFALPSPHAPIIPNDEFDGKTNAGAYGDFMYQTDFIIGQLLDALKEKGIENETIVIFSSDNGPERYAWERVFNYGHYSMGHFRGLKRDVWEGGHHVPLLIKWPGKIDSGSVSEEVISQIDIMATIASLINIELPKGAAPDSYDFSSVLTGKTYESPVRKTTVHNTKPGTWAIRHEEWLYINASSGEHSKMPEEYSTLKGYTQFDTPGLLFNLADDPEQRINLFNTFPQKAEDMMMLLKRSLEE